MKLSTIFRVLGQAFLQLADMAGDETVQVMTGTDYIATLDKPDNGTNTPSAVFATSRPDPAAEPAPVVATPATVFAAAEPVYTMTDKAAGFTREQYHDTGWDDDGLVAAGMMTVTGPKPAPVTAAVDPSLTAPVAPAPISTPPAPSPVAPSGAPQPPAAVSPSAPAPASSDETAVALDPAHALRDNGGKGIRWDARIHSSSREINEKDGMWRKKRGATPVEIARITAELLGAAPAPSAPPFVPLAPSAPPAASPSAPAAQTAGVPATFADLCKWITATGRTMPQAALVAANYGMGSMGILAQPANASIIPLVYADLVAAE